MTAGRQKRISLAATLACCLISTSLSLAAGVAPDKASKEQLEAAQRTFQAADGLYDAKRYEEAITAFRASYEIVGSPNSRLMIARSMREAGRLTEAWAELEGTIADADAAAKLDDKYASTAKAAREDLKKLEAAVARVQFERSGFSSPLSVNGKPIPEALLAGPVALAPGKAVVTAKRADGSEARVDLELEAGQSRHVKLDLGATEAKPTPPPPAPPPKPAPSPQPESSSGPGLRTWAFVAGGVGVAGLATFGIFGSMNNSKFSALEDDCEGGRCPSSSQDDIDAGKRYQTIANIGLAVGVVGIGTGAALFFLGGDSSKEGAKGAKSARFSPVLRVGPGNLSFGGRFQ